MTAELRRGLTLAILGLLVGLVLVAGLLGDGRTALNRLATNWRGAPSDAGAPPAAGPGRAEAPGAPTPGGEGRQAAAPPPAQTTPNAPAEAPKPEAAPVQAGGRPETAKPEPARPDATKPDPARPEQRTAAAAPAPGRATVVPAFDVIRVEPSGESVVAGRAMPGATIEMLRGGEPFARALADATGLFAIVPPALPRGTSEITLRMIAPDGSRATSKDTAVIVVPQGGGSKPLIALTSPDKPTVVLSQPDAAVAAKPVAGAPPVPEAARPGAQTPVKVVSVDAESGGRLFVTAQAPPGATVRLYLNDTLVAPAGAGQDGKVAFAIGRGVQAGQYKVRIDQVDPVSGEVRNRSEVPFTFPLTLAGPPAAPSATTMSRSPEAEALSGKRVADLARQQERTAPPAAPTPAAPALEAPAAPAASAPPAAVAEVPSAAVAPIEGTVPGARVYVPELATLTVSRGDNLWSISRKSYGRGARYTVIYDANQDQIRNPGLIYPGQIFVMPQKDAHQAEKH